MTAIERVAAEREKQKSKYPIKHDDSHSDGVLAVDAAILALSFDPQYCVFDTINSKNMQHDHCGCVEKYPTDYAKCLIIAAALLIAEVERFERTPMGQPRQ